MRSRWCWPFADQRCYGAGKRWGVVSRGNDLWLRGPGRAPFSTRLVLPPPLRRSLSQPGDLRCQCVFSWPICAMGVRRISRFSRIKPRLEYNASNLLCFVRRTAVWKSIDDRTSERDIRHDWRVTVSFAIFASCVLWYVSLCYPVYLDYFPTTSARTKSLIHIRY